MDIIQIADAVLERIGFVSKVILDNNRSENICILLIALSVQFATATNLY